MSGFQEISMRIQPYDNRDFAPGCLPQLKIRIESKGCQSRQQGFHGSELISVRDHQTLNPRILFLMIKVGVFNDPNIRLCEHSTQLKLAS